MRGATMHFSYWGGEGGQAPLRLCKGSGKQQDSSLKKFSSITDHHLYFFLFLAAGLSIGFSLKKQFVFTVMNDFCKTFGTRCACSRCRFAFIKLRLALTMFLFLLPLAYSSDIFSFISPTFLSPSSLSVIITTSDWRFSGRLCTIILADSR